MDIVGHIRRVVREITGARDDAAFDRDRWQQLYDGVIHTLNEVKKGSALDFRGYLICGQSTVSLKTIYPYGENTLWESLAALRSVYTEELNRNWRKPSFWAINQLLAITDQLIDVTCAENNQFSSEKLKNEFLIKCAKEACLTAALAVKIENTGKKPRKTGIVEDEMSKATAVLGLSENSLKNLRRHATRPAESIKQALISDQEVA